MAAPSEKRIRITLPGDPAQSEEFSHGDIPWFVRAVIDWHDMGQYQREIKKAVEDLNHRGVRKRDGSKFEGIADDRIRNFIARPSKSLLSWEEEFVCAALHHRWLIGVSSDLFHRLADRARLERKRAGLTPQALSKLLGLATRRGSQAFVHKLRGSYFIFRLGNPTQLLAAYMKVGEGEIPDPDHKYPAVFVTHSQPVAGKPATEGLIQGILYCPDEVHEVVHTVGLYDESTQIRIAIAKVISKPVRNPERYKGRQDFIAVRLGLTRDEHMPHAYRIYCARLDDNEPPAGWQTFASEFRLIKSGKGIKLAQVAGFREKFGVHPHDFFAAHVPGFENILHWLCTKQATEIEPYPTIIDDAKPTRRKMRGDTRGPSESPSAGMKASARRVRTRKRGGKLR